MTAFLLYAKIHKNKAENLLHLMLYFSLLKKSEKRWLTKPFSHAKINKSSGARMHNN